MSYCIIAYMMARLTFSPQEAMLARGNARKKQSTQEVKPPKDSEEFVGKNREENRRQKDRERTEKGRRRCKRTEMG